MDTRPKYGQVIDVSREAYALKEDLPDTTCPRQSNSAASRGGRRAPVEARKRDDQR